MVRRLSAARGANLRPAPGAYGRLPAWLSRDHWCDVVLPAALARRHRLAKHHPVDPDTARRIARLLSESADHRTGRNARPTVEVLAERAQCSVRTVQRALKLLEALGVVVRVVEGRSAMTRTERLWTWRNGSSARQIAAEFALVVPRDLARVAAAAARRPVDRVTPPGPHEVSGLGTDPISSPQARKDPRRSRAAPGTHRKARARPITPAELRRDRLIAGSRRAVPWLAGVSPRRLRWLGRFAAHGWTQDDVVLACGEVLQARGWQVPRRIEQPAAFLWSLLRDVDPGDRPTAYIEAQLAEERARREWVWLTDARYSTAPECRHGQPAGNVPHPIDGHLACPFCRKDHHGPAH